MKILQDQIKILKDGAAKQIIFFSYLLCMTFLPDLQRHIKIQHISFLVDSFQWLNDCISLNVDVDTDIYTALFVSRAPVKYLDSLGHATIEKVCSNI